MFEWFNWYVYKYLICWLRGKKHLDYLFIFLTLVSSMLLLLVPSTGLLAENA